MARSESLPVLEPAEVVRVEGHAYVYQSDVNRTEIERLRHGDVPRSHVGRYRRGAFAWAVTATPDEDGVYVAIVLRRATLLMDAPPGRATLNADAAEILSLVPSDSDWHATVSLQYDEATRSLIQFPIPLSLPGVTEIRGMRLVRIEGDEPQYDIVVDRPSTILYHSVTLPVTGGFGVRLLKHVMRRGVEISRQLIVGKDSDGNAYETTGK